MLSDEWLQRYRLLENFTAKWNGNGNAYDRDDYNSSFALRAVELKMTILSGRPILVAILSYEQSIHLIRINIIFCIATASYTK